MVPFKSLVLGNQIGEAAESDDVGAQLLSHYGHPRKRLTD
jgi:hypothetical protein